MTAANLNAALPGEGPAASKKIHPFFGVAGNHPAL
jgi:hypothetical protein